MPPKSTTPKGGNPFHARPLGARDLTIRLGVMLYPLSTGGPRA